jgi:membrane protease YdiL (CAAX protease family)
MTTSTRPSPTVSAARRGLAVYLVAVTALSAPLQLGIIRTNALADVGTAILWLAGLMLVPTLASVIARLVQHEGFADLGFRRGHDVGRALAFAVVLPFLVGAVAYGAAWATGAVGLRLPPPAGWVATFVAMLLINVVVSTGEELGWRGYLLPHLVAAGVRGPVLVSSLIWGGWHVPLVVWGGLFPDSPSRVVAAAMLMVTTTAIGYVLGRLRLDTGNVWPAALLHIVWNTVIQTGFDPAVTGEDKALWIGETGVFTLVTLIAVALGYRHRRPATPPAPGTPEPATREFHGGDAHLAARG